MNPEESEADDGAGNTSNQIGDIFHAIDGQNCWPYDDSSEQANEYGRDIVVVRKLDKLIEVLSDKGAEPEEDDMSDLNETEES